MLESQRLAEDGAVRLAALNLVLSLAGGLALLSLGWTLGSVL
jgi:fluoride ion exporter CrcB/FEX